MCTCSHIVSFRVGHYICQRKTVHNLVWKKNLWKTINNKRQNERIKVLAYKGTVWSSAWWKKARKESKVQKDDENGAVHSVCQQNQSLPELSSLSPSSPWRMTASFPSFCLHTVCTWNPVHFKPNSRDFVLPRCLGVTWSINREPRRDFSSPNHRSIPSIIPLWFFPQECSYTCKPEQSRELWHITIYDRGIF